MKFGICLMVATLALPTGAIAKDSVTVATFGGSYQEQMQKAWYGPAAEKLGVDLTMDIVGTVADVRAHIQGGKTNWDVIQLAGSSCAAAEKEGLLQPLDYTVINTTGLPKEIVTPHTVGALQYSTMLVWNKEAFKGEEPTSWADFYDVKKFPQARASDNRAVFTMEIALLADGVPLDQLYPLDIPRAMAKAKTLLPDITAFFGNGAVATQLMRDGEVDMMPLFENRVHDLIRQGVPLGYTLNQAIVDINCLVVPNGAKQPELSMKLINEVLSPEINARIAEVSDMSPANTLAFENGIIAPERAKELSSLPENMKNQVRLNQDFWAPRIGEVTQEYKAMIAE